MTATRPEQPTPDYVPGHDLLAGKVVVVTAAAGAGIGASVVRRALEEGAKAVVFCDTHARRLAEAEEALAAEFGADRVRQLVCDVTDEDQVQALLDAADEFGGVDVMINNAGLGGTASILEMTDEQWLQGPRHHPDRHLPLRPRGRAADGRRRHEGRDRQQRLGHRLARAGGPGALRRGQGRRDGADPLLGPRPRPARHPGQRGLAEPGDAPVPGQGDLRRAAPRAQAARGVRPRGRAVGGRQRDGLPGQRLRVVPDRRGRLREQSAA